MLDHKISGGSGVQLHVREWGRKDGPELLFIHGWSQCHMCWDKQVTSDLAKDYRMISLDLRGHGMSEKPASEEAYTDSRLWADDVAAVVSTLCLNRPIFHVWSYGGLVLCDYIRHHGADHVGGINFVGAATTLNTEAFGTFIGPGFFEPFADATADDLSKNIAAMRRFLRSVTNNPLPTEEFETALCWNMVVPPEVRGALGARNLDNDDVLAGLSVPTLVTQGLEDTIVLPEMGKHILEVCPTAKASWYKDIGHAPMLEDPNRFNKELREAMVTA
ncbi:alpha/beta hydrolase [Aestuariicoccus sp. MJ-SS9]|uniref:alpha/beta fold hydrolase n=1 Tax=Aestuariicoccus sp. MJ-SS9 TaxID=3079855 RepID=UPI00290BEE04|nr:alpha/beta hydrolase [Aestuariicoccus sp. MJ-SS9]MDU8914079.1 alpha/beta hydrolase [Aestuariicoccus sp. MJ-SS9]